MRPKDIGKSQGPFEALLAASGTLEAAETSRSCGKPKLGRAPSRADLSSAGHSELESADNTAIGGAYAEGIGTSGGGESGDTELQSEDSEDSRASEGLRGEGSECKSSQGGSESSRNKAMAGKKQRMVWTIELHKRFLNAVNHLDMENAVPKVILKMMNVDGITRENVASHLQKYRLHLRHQSGLQASKVDSKRAFQLEEAPQHHNVDLKSAPAIMTQGLPIPHSTPVPQSSTAGSTALGLPLSSPLAPYQMAGRLIVGKPCEHIPPQAWAAGVPGYDALRKLAQIPEEQKASLLMDLTAPRPLPEDSRRRPPVQVFKSAPLDITPLTTAQPPAAKPD